MTIAQSNAAAQANAAQREPSMEEILASIRRIIEDSDPQHDTANDDRPGPAVSSAREKDEAQAFRAELQADRNETIEREELSFASRRPLAAVTPLRGTIDASAEPAPVTTVRQPDVKSSPQPQPKPVAVAVRPEPAKPETAVAPKPSAPPPLPTIEATRVATVTPAPAPALALAARPAIISEVAGRQVAASFGELSDAFAASRRRSFDEVAEEMMRPLLQEWMDNNLPRLVEKLVREEIERIARGASD